MCAQDGDGIANGGINRISRACVFNRSTGKLQHRARQLVHTDINCVIGSPACDQGILADGKFTRGETLNCRAHAVVLHSACAGNGHAALACVEYTVSIVRALQKTAFEDENRAVRRAALQVNRTARVAGGYRAVDAAAFAFAAIDDGQRAASAVPDGRQVVFAHEVFAVQVKGEAFVVTGNFTLALMFFSSVTV